MALCNTCGAQWSAGAYSPHCDECGGSAMERPCLYCGGKCGAVMLRAVSDSNDSGLAHWAGRCHLPAPKRG